MSSSFFGNLAKGFVRSAVNQVGRDAGRVVSNGVYGDRHSIPIRNVSGNERIARYGEVKVESRQRLLPSESNAIVAVLIGCCFTLVGGIVLLLVGISKSGKKTIVYEKQVQSQAVYVADGRCKDGMRYDGDNLMQRKVPVAADEYEIELNTKIANIYKYGGIAAIVFWSIVLMVTNA